METVKELQFIDLQLGQVFDFGSVVLSEDDIIRFAQQYDPMPFHVDLEAAQNSPFKGLIASGPHLFHHFYVQHWVPLFKNSVYAGRGIHNWMLHKPVYANQPSFCTVSVNNWAPKPERGFGVVEWHFKFTDAEQTVLQHLDLIVMHKL